MAQSDQLAAATVRLTTSTDAHRWPATPALRLVAGSGPTAGSTTGRIHRPADPRPLVAQLAQAISEVLARARHAGQLDGLLSAEAVRALQRAVEITSPLGGAAMPRPRVHSLRITTPRVDAVEACAVIDVGRRTRALAFRLDHRNDRWTCTAMRVG
jgi:hypothetical protein